MKRDLKADLELFNRATPGPWEFGPIYAGTIAGELDEERDRANRELLNNFREGWPHAIERAIKAEELTRELMEVLTAVMECEDYYCICGGISCEPGLCPIANSARRVLLKTKEVLGDEIK